MPSIPFPAADLSPPLVRFLDPSLRNYPDPSVPAAAVQPIREVPSIATSYVRIRRRFPKRRRQFSRARRQAEGEDDFFLFGEEEEEGREGLEERNKQQQLAQEVFSPEFIPLPGVSDPSYALPVSAMEMLSFMFQQACLNPFCTYHNSSH